MKKIWGNRSRSLNGKSTHRLSCLVKKHGKCHMFNHFSINNVLSDRSIQGRALAMHSHPSPSPTTLIFIQCLISPNNILVGLTPLPLRNSESTTEGRLPMIYENCRYCLKWYELNFSNLYKQTDLVQMGQYWTYLKLFLNHALYRGIRGKLCQAQNNLWTSPISLRRHN